jgi:hypothetical protein
MPGYADLALLPLGGLGVYCLPYNTLCLRGPLQRGDSNVRRMHRGEAERAGRSR